MSSKTFKLNHKVSIFVMLIMSVVYSLPLFVKNVVYLHAFRPDLIFHWTRIVGLDNVWSSPVSFTGFGQHGNIVNEFYPWLTLYPAFILFKLFGNMMLAWQLFILLATISAMFIAYYSMWRIKNNSCTALIFALMYGFSSYGATNVIQRGDAGEFLAMVYTPLVLLGCYEIVTKFLYRSLFSWF
jgi:hypothetical protein